MQNNLLHERRTHSAGQQRGIFMGRRRTRDPDAVLDAFARKMSFAAISAMSVGLGRPLSRSPACAGTLVQIPAIVTPLGTLMCPLKR